MCGIVGHIGTNLASVGVVLGGLRDLEYRGYDSAGISTLEQSEGGNILVTFKAKGKVNRLADKVGSAELSEPGPSIGHTRWATHGKPTERNAHPHTDCKETISVVHNGIIDNYIALKAELERNGHRFKSRTDTEVIPHLIEREFDCGAANLEDAVRIALRYVRGVFAIAVISSRDPGKIVIARRKAPLVLGLCDEDFIIASDHPPILPYTNRVVYLENDEMAVITAHGFRLMNIWNDTKREPEVVTLDMSVEEARKGGFEHFMLKEIHEAPIVVENAIRGRIDLEWGIAVLPELDELGDAIANARRFVFASCGTSLFASMIAAKLIRRLAKVPAEAEYASELRYHSDSLGPDDVVIVVSQSGETADTLAALEQAKACGSKVIAVVNVVGSMIARSADATLYLHAGPEIAVASTKAFISQLAVLVLLSLHAARLRGAGGDRSRVVLEALRKLPGLLSEALGASNRIRDLADKCSRFENALFLGRGLGYPLALEGALKLKEVSYIHAEGYPAGEMKHGPNALITEDLLTLAVALEDGSEDYVKMLSNISEVSSRGGPVVAIAFEGDQGIADLVGDVMYIPKTEPELCPILAVVPMQLLAYHVALCRGTDVDQPRNLAKSVTVE